MLGYVYINRKRTLNFITRTMVQTNPFAPKYEDIPFVKYDYSIERKRNLKIENTIYGGVPRNIFQAYINQSNKIPLEVQDNINFLKDNNPNWKYYLITDNNIQFWLEKINDKKYIKIYNDISKEYPAAKIDILRYLLMKHFGGVYMDIKSTSIRPLDNVISEGTDQGKVMLFKWCAFKSPIFRLCYWRTGERKYKDELVQWLLIYPKGHQFIDELLQNINKKYEEYKNNKNIKQDIYAFTGPDIYTDTIMPLTTENNAVIYDSYVDLGFDYNILKYDHSIYSKKKHYLLQQDKNIKIIN